MCIRDTFAVSYNERAIFPCAQQQVLRAKPAYAWMVPRKWHQRKAGIELCHFLLALRILLRGNAILANVPQTTNTSKLTQHLSLPRFPKHYHIQYHVTKKNQGNLEWKWRLLGDSRPRAQVCSSPKAGCYLKVAFKAVKTKGHERSIRARPNFHGPLVVPLVCIC